MTDVMWNIFKIRNTIITEPGKNMKEAKDGDVLNTGFETSFHFLHPLRPILTIKIQKKELYKNGATPDTRNLESPIVKTVQLGESDHFLILGKNYYSSPQTFEKLKINEYCRLEDKEEDFV